MKQNFDHDAAGCYGRPGSRGTFCVNCQYRQSCSFFAATAKSVESRSKLASYEEMQNWMTETADFDHIPGESKDTGANSGFISMLGQFFRYLISLDDYTVGIICEVINSGNKRTPCTVAELGRLHGCSRQAMHRKILDIIAGKPELSSLLQGTMYKLSRGRQRFIRNRREAALGKV